MHDNELGQMLRRSRAISPHGPLAPVRRDVARLIREVKALRAKLSPGRPRIVDDAKVRHLRRLGRTAPEIADRLGVSPATVWRALERLEKR